MTDNELRQKARIEGIPCSKCGQLVRYDDFHFDCPALPHNQVKATKLEERERVLKEIEACLEKQRREEHHHLDADIERTIRRLREEL